jgi:hypothetical protein
VSIHAKLLRQAGKPRQAGAIWRWLIAQPGLDSVDRNEAVRELDRLRATLDAGTGGDDFPVDGTLAGVLAMIARETGTRAEPA